jgi:hypothetical protein
MGVLARGARSVGVAATSTHMGEQPMILGTEPRLRPCVELLERGVESLPELVAAADPGEPTAAAAS